MAFYSCQAGVRMQEGHAAADAHPSCELTAVTDEHDVSASRAEADQLLADDYNIPYIADLDQALKLPEVDIVSACPDVERRGRVAVQCADSGKCLYLDKPLAGTNEDARAIVEAVDRNGVTARCSVRCIARSPKPPGQLSGLPESAN
ncbi:MAG: Gfo/Idh/MocA family oxidoreductase [Dehalococcoidia bacterium]